MRRSRKPYWAEHVPRRWDGAVVRRSTVAVLTTGTLVGLTALATGPAPDDPGTGGGLCTGESHDRARALLTELRTDDDPRARELATELTALGLDPAVRPAGWQQKAVDLSDALNGTTDPALHEVAVRLAAAGYGPTPADLLPADGERTLPAGCVTPVAVTDDTPRPPGADTATRLLGDLVDELSTSNDDGAGALSRAISSALEPTRVVDLPFDPSQLAPADPADPAGASDPAAPGGQADREAADPAWRSGARTLAEQVTSAAATDPLAAELADTLDRLEILPQAPADAPADTATEGGAGTGSAGWEAGAAELAEQVTASAGADPLARELAERLDAAGFTTPVPEGADEPTDGTDSADSADDGTGDSAADGAAGAADGAAGAADGAAGEGARSWSPGDPVSRVEGLGPATGGAGDDTGSDTGEDSAEDSGDDTGSGSDGPADPAGDTAGDAAGDAGEATREITREADAAPTEGTVTEPAAPGAADGPTGWEAGAEQLVEEVTAAAGDDPLARELSDRLTAAGFGSGRGTVEDTTWDRLAECESGGDWSIDTGNGYSGGLQFAPATWEAFGGEGAAHRASREDQIAVAEKVLAAQGWEAWPSCSAQLGLQSEDPR